MMKVILKRVTEDPEALIEEAYRECYQSEFKGGEEGGAFIRRNIKRGHESPLEHAVATFKISGVSRALSHQLVRHRIASYTQRSQRYVNEENAEFVIPESISKNKAALCIYELFLRFVKIVYKQLTLLGVPIQDARYVLPNATTTEIMITFNFRSYLNFLRLRTDMHAQWEIREMANLICDELLKVAPNVFSEFSEKK